MDGLADITNSAAETKTKDEQIVALTKAYKLIYKISQASETEYDNKIGYIMAIRMLIDFNYFTIKDVKDDYVFESKDWKDDILTLNFDSLFTHSIFLSL